MAIPFPNPLIYRGRLAPSPTGYLHLGHARTFWTAQQRAQQAGGTLILRNDDLDRARCRAEYVAAMSEDLRWFGFEWSEGPDRGGPFGPYNQSERMHFYRAALAQLKTAGFLYPCLCSRKDIASAVAAPHADDDEPIYPGTCRLRRETDSGGKPCSWRFRVPEGRVIQFHDQNLGPQTFVAGRDFGDFVVWRPDDVPAYQLACVVDDARMEVSEVVRGADLLASTARQWLLYEALGMVPPQFFHCALMLDGAGRRMAKRHDSLTLRVLRAGGATPESLRRSW
jgi:glutamyl-tRNA synthetase